MNGKNLTEVISSCIQSAGISPHLKGYTYIRSMVLYIYDDYELLHCFMFLYQKVAKCYHVKPESVERAIRNAINIAYDKHREQLNSIFIYSIEKPKNSEFISVIAEKVRVLMAEELNNIA